MKWPIAIADSRFELDREAAVATLLAHPSDGLEQSPSSSAAT